MRNTQGIPEGDCDCEGNQLDIAGICGGDCTTDFNSNGVCDDQESLDPDEYRLEVDTVVVHEFGDVGGVGGVPRRGRSWDPTHVNECGDCGRDRSLDH